MENQFRQSKHEKLLILNQLDLDIFNDLQKVIIELDKSYRLRLTYRKEVNDKFRFKKIQSR